MVSIVFSKLREEWEKTFFPILRMFFVINFDIPRSTGVRGGYAFPV